MNQNYFLYKDLHLLCVYKFLCVFQNPTSYMQDSVVTAVNEISVKMFNLPYTNHTGLFAQTHFLNFEISSKILSLYSRKILGKGEQNVGENQLKIKKSTYRPTT